MVYCKTQWDDVTLARVYGNAIDHEKSAQKAEAIAKRMFLLQRWRSTLGVLKLRGRQHVSDLKVIDYGCGWGDFVDVVDGRGVQCVGYDQDREKIASAKDSGRRIVETVEELEAFGPVDVVFMNSVLEHLMDVDYHLQLVRRLLKRDGLFVFSVMDYRPRYIRRNMKRLEQGRPALTKNLSPVEHVNVYDYRSVMQTLKRFGFRFIATGHSLYLCDCFRAQSKRMVRLFNMLERLSVPFVDHTSITTYAANARMPKTTS